LNVFSAVVVLLQIAIAQPPLEADTFGDPGAAELVARARHARARQQVTLTGFSAMARERGSARLRTRGRERLVYRREIAAQLDWRGTAESTVTLLGAREYLPVPRRSVRVLPDAATEALDVAYVPDEFASILSLGSYRFGPHPLNPGSEADYRFHSGGTEMLDLPDGGAVQAREIVVMPRRSAPDLVAGTIWVEESTGRIVREAYRKVEPIRAAGVLPFSGGIDSDPREIFIEHGLWGDDWWLPRIVAVEGFSRAGSATLSPFRYERLYSDYIVHGDGTSVLPDDLAFQPVRPGITSARWQVVMPGDLSSLLTSEFLPVSIFDEGAAPVLAAVLDPLRARLGDIALPFLQGHGDRGYARLAPIDGLRFNRIEGLSLNVVGSLNLGRFRTDAEARIATAGQALRGQLGLALQSRLGEFGITGFERVQATDLSARPFDAGNSLSTLLLGEDYGQYYSARGLEFVREAAAEAAMPWTLRLYMEEQDSVVVEDPPTFGSLWGNRDGVRAGIDTEPARQFGMAFDLSVGGGLGPEQFQWRLDPQLEAATGDFDFARASLVAGVSAPVLTRGAGPLRRGLSLGIEAAAGGSTGVVPGQALWHLGGPATLRGYPAASMAGDRYWRTRFDIGTTFPVMRVVAFGDIGQARGRGGVEGDPRLVSLGVGFSYLEGLVRLDLARAVRFRPGWRVNFAVDNLL